jgi:hypothetical protein
MALSSSWQGDSALLRKLPHSRRFRIDLYRFFWYTNTKVLCGSMHIHDLGGYPYG